MEIEQKNDNRNHSFGGHRALVCGASKGIGRAVAIELARQGAQVIALARSAEALESLMSELVGEGHQSLVVDLADLPSLRQKIQGLVADSAISILVNNAGGPPGGPIVDAPWDQFLTALTVHLGASQTLVQALLPKMREQKFGRIINIISTSVKIPIANLGVSNTVRGAMASWAKTLSMEIAKDGITVNNVLPGFTKTGRLTNLLAQTADRLGKTPEQVEKMWLATVPAGRFAEPEELADAVAFLASPRSGFINGMSLPVDGGRTGSL